MTLLSHFERSSPSLFSGLPCSCCHVSNRSITAATLPFHTQRIHSTYNLQPSTLLSPPKAFAAAYTYDIAWMKSRIGVYDENRLFHTRQIAASAHRRRRPCGPAGANPDIQARHASITPKIGQLCRDATTRRFSSFGPLYSNCSISSSGSTSPELSALIRCGFFLLDAKSRRLLESRARSSPHVSDREMFSESLERDRSR